MILRYDRLGVEIPAGDPDPAGATAVQELMGGRFGEMSTLMNYTLQSFGFRGRRELRPFYDLIANIAAEEYGHIELVATAINTMLTGASPTDDGKAPSDSLRRSSTAGARRSRSVRTCPRQQMSHGYYVNVPTRSEYHYRVLYTEARLGSLLALGRGEAPLDHWFALVRTYPPEAGGGQPQVPLESLLDVLVHGGPPVLRHRGLLPV